MASGAAHWALVHVDDWTWFVADYRGWLMALAVVVGLAAPFLGTARRHQRPPAPSLVIRSGAMALGFSAAAVTVCSLLHFSDLRWLPPGERSAAHLTAPGGIFGFARPMVTVVNSIAGIPVEFRAAQVSVHTAIACAFLALAAFLMVAMTWRRARRAEVRQVVQEELLKMEIGTRVR